MQHQGPLPDPEKWAEFREQLRARSNRGHTAVIAIDPDKVPGDYCTVEVLVNDENGEMTSRVADAPVETPVRTDHGDVLAVVPPNANQLLERAGWQRMSAWQLHDGALYAAVRREH